MSDSADSSRLCGRCARPASNLCARCLAVAFCSENCQRLAWRDHKPLCVPAATAATALVVAPRKAPPLGELPQASMSFERIVMLLKRHAADKDIAASGLAALRDKVYAESVKESEPKIRAFIEAGAVVAVVDALRLHVASEDVCHHAACLISGCISVAPGLIAEEAARAVAPLVRALEIYAPSSPVTVSKWLCLSLRGILDFVFSLEQEALRAGALPALLGAVRRYTSGAVVAAKASDAWVVVTEASDALAILFLAKEGKEAGVAMGAVNLLVEVLRTHGASDCGIFSSAVRALTNIIDVVENKFAAVRAEVIAHICVALRKFLEDETSCVDALRAMVSIVSMCPEGRAAAVIKNAVPLVADALQRHVVNMELVEFAAVIIFYCVGRAGNLWVLPILCTALRTHSASEKSCEVLSAAIQNVALLAGGPAAAVAAGAIPCLVKNLRTHAASLAVVCASGGALSAICTMNEAHRAAAIGEGVLPLITSAIARHGAGACAPLQGTLTVLLMNR